MGVFVVRNSVLAGALVCMMLGQPAQQTAGQSAAPQQQSIPDAPKPQGLPAVGSVAPGIGTTQDSNGDSSASETKGQTNAPPSSLPASPAQTTSDDGKEPELPAAGEGVKAFTLVVNTNFVEVPFTVKDNKGRTVPGLTWRDIRIYENGYRQQPAVFTVDPFPLSVALVIDQSLTYDNMERVNNSLEAVQGAFTAYDEVAVFTYNNGPRLVTDFTAGPSARLTQALERSKGTGREPLQVQGGPLAQTTTINGYQFDPNTAPVRNHQGIDLTVPKEPHTLNDAILAAATALAKTRPGRRRVIYVISDGKEYGSTAKYKQVLQYLQTHQISVYGTLVGDSSLPVVGTLDKIHIPLTMRDNLLHTYVVDTGGDYDAEFRQKGIENSFAKIAEEVRGQYTIGYYTHEPFIDGKYRGLDVRVLRPNLQVFAKKGYYPTVNDVRPSMAPAQ
jgi:VWFA-related protein